MAQSRREQLQAYRFMQRRVRTALLDADPDTSDAPMSRMGVATYAGIMVAIVVLAVAGIFGVLRPGGSSAWKKTGALIVERETSTRYVYLDGTLYQVANYSSAKLLLGDRLQVVTVSSKSLGKARHGGSIGIPGAPDYVPDSKHIVGSTWSACVAGNLAGSDVNATMYQPGVTAGSPAFAADQGILLKSDSTTYLVWNSHAYRIPNQWLTALRYGDTTPVVVDEDLITALPRGEDLKPVAVKGAGNKGPTLPNDRPGGLASKVGQVLVDTTNANLYFLVLPNGHLAYLTSLQATLLLAQKSTQQLNGGASPLKVNSGGVAPSRLGPLPNLPAADQRAPKTIPKAVTPAAGNQLCAVLKGGTASVVYGLQPPAAPGDASSGLVRLRTGYGAIVGAVAHVGAQPSALYLVSDSGQKFAVKSEDVLSTLGISGTSVASLPAQVVAAIPGSVVLDPDAARQIAGGGTAPKPN